MWSLNKLFSTSPKPTATSARVISRHYRKELIKKTAAQQPIETKLTQETLNSDINLVFFVSAKKFKGCQGLKYVIQNHVQTLRDVQPILSSVLTVDSNKETRNKDKKLGNKLANAAKVVKESNELKVAKNAVAFSFKQARNLFRFGPKNQEEPKVSVKETMPRTIWPQKSPVITGEKVMQMRSETKEKEKQNDESGKVEILNDTGKNEVDENIAKNEQPIESGWIKEKHTEITSLSSNKPDPLRHDAKDEAMQLSRPDLERTERLQRLSIARTLRPRQSKKPSGIAGVNASATQNAKTENIPNLTNLPKLDTNTVKTVDRMTAIKDQPNEPDKYAMTVTKSDQEQAEHQSWITGKKLKSDLEEFAGLIDAKNVEVTKMSEYPMKKRNDTLEMSGHMDTSDTTSSSANKSESSAAIQIHAASKSDKDTNDKSSQTTTERSTKDQQPEKLNSSNLPNIVTNNQRQTKDPKKANKTDDTTSTSIPQSIREPGVQGYHPESMNSPNVPNVVSPIAAAAEAAKEAAEKEAKNNDQPKPKFANRMDPVIYKTDGRPASVAEPGVHGYQEESMNQPNAPNIRVNRQSKVASFKKPSELKPYEAPISATPEGNEQPIEKASGVQSYHAEELNAPPSGGQATNKTEYVSDSSTEGSKTAKSNDPNDTTKSSNINAVNVELGGRTTDKVKFSPETETTPSQQKINDKSGNYSNEPMVVYNDSEPIHKTGDSATNPETKLKPAVVAATDSSGGMAKTKTENVDEEDSDNYNKKMGIGVIKEVRVKPSRSKVQDAIEKPNVILTSGAVVQTHPDGTPKRVPKKKPMEEPYWKGLAKLTNSGDSGKPLTGSQEFEEIIKISGDKNDRNPVGYSSVNESKNFGSTKQKYTDGLNAESGKQSDGNDNVNLKLEKIPNAEKAFEAIDKIPVVETKVYPKKKLQMKREDELQKIKQNIAAYASVKLGNKPSEKIEQKLSPEEEMQRIKDKIAAYASAKLGKEIVKEITPEKVMKSDPIPEIKQTKATEPIILDNNKPVYEQTVREIKTNSNEIIKKKAVAIEEELAKKSAESAAKVAQKLEKPTEVRKPRKKLSSSLDLRTQRLPTPRANIRRIYRSQGFVRGKIVNDPRPRDILNSATAKHVESKPSLVTQVLKPPTIQDTNNIPISHPIKRVDVKKDEPIRLTGTPQTNTVSNQIHLSQPIKPVIVKKDESIRLAGTTQTNTVSNQIHLSQPTKPADVKKDEPIRLTGTTQTNTVSNQIHLPQPTKHADVKKNESNRLIGTTPTISNNIHLHQPIKPTDIKKDQSIRLTGTTQTNTTSHNVTKRFPLNENKIMAVSLNSRIPRKKTPLNSKPIIPIYANDEEFMTSEIQPTKKDLADEHQIHETEVDPFDDDTLHYYVPFKPNKENKTTLKAEGHGKQKAPKNKIDGDFKYSELEDVIDTGDNSQHGPTDGDPYDEHNRTKDVPNDSGFNIRSSKPPVKDPRGNQKKALSVDSKRIDSDGDYADDEYLHCKPPKYEIKKCPYPVYCDRPDPIKKK